MEQARYWTWTKRNRDFNPLVPSSYSTPSYDDSSWEEQAFAEDASGHLGGCIWPPRSYSCSFCRREFRSAQALGGHMNVHRRDRARLKQSSPSALPQNEIFVNPHHHHHDRHQNLAYNALEFRFPSQNCDSTLGSNPNPSSDPLNVTSPSLKRSIHQENYCEKILFPNISSSCTTLKEQRSNKRSSPRSSSPNNSNMVSEPRKEGERSTSRILEKGSRSNELDYANNSDNLSVSLSLVVRKPSPTLSEGEEESIVGCKRRRTEISPCSIEELDLELRLGTERSKVK